MFTSFANITGATKQDEAPVVGSSVKAVFESASQDGIQGEGMWITVTKVLPNLKYEGVLDNEPFYTPLELGAEVAFDWSHVREVLAP